MFFIKSNSFLVPLYSLVSFWILFISCNFSAGLIPSDKESAIHPLRQRGGGNAVVIAVGGAPEALDARPGSFDVLLAKKKGFIKMAMEHG